MRVVSSIVVVFLVLIQACPLSAAERSSPIESADVVVYGATPAGICAAVAAAREGATVILAEPTNHVGGLITSGLSFSDSNQTVRSTLMGLFDEWYRRAEKDYEQRGIKLPYRVSEKNSAKWTVEPSVASRVCREMLDEAKVRVLTGEQLHSVKKSGTDISEVVTAKGRLAGKTWIDATYEGDLMAAAGVSWTIGRESRDEHGESLAGRHYSKLPLKMSGRNDDGSLLPLITTGERGEEGTGDRNVMVYSFRLCLTKEPANRIPFPAPKNYDPARFEVIRRYFLQLTPDVFLWDLYQIPNDKMDANNAIGKQFSMGLVGASSAWCEADPETRQQIWEDHRQYTLEMYQFLTTDPAIPRELRKRLADYGLCKDEFIDSDHWPPQLYVREGRRLKGEYVLTQQDIEVRPEKEDAVAISSFPVDSHDCERVAIGTEAVLNEGTIFPVHVPGTRHGPAFHVPYRSLLPKADECSNLVVPVALSSTHVAYSSIRVEPTWMAIGQSAGIAAAAAARGKVSVQELPYAKLRERLQAQGQVLEIPPGTKAPTAEQR